MFLPGRVCKLQESVLQHSKFITVSMLKVRTTVWMPADGQLERFVHPFVTKPFEVVDEKQCVDSVGHLSLPSPPHNGSEHCTH